MSFCLFDAAYVDAMVEFLMQDDGSVVTWGNAANGGSSCVTEVEYDFDETWGLSEFEMHNGEGYGQASYSCLESVRDRLLSGVISVHHSTVHTIKESENSKYTSMDRGRIAWAALKVSHVQESTSGSINSIATVH